MNYVGDLKQHAKASVTVAASRTLVHKKRRFASSSSSGERIPKKNPEPISNTTLVNKRRPLMSSSSSDGGMKNQTKYNRNKTVKIKAESPEHKLEHKSAHKAKKSSNSVSKNVSRKSSKAHSKKTTKRISSGSEKSDFSRSASVLNAT